MLKTVVEYRAAVLSFAAIIGILFLPFYMFSQHELAPVEDQGYLFGFIKSPANATLDQVTLFSDEINKAFMSAPEVENTFLINSPAGGFGGLVTKPWNQRKRSTQEISMELFPKTGAIAGLQVIPDHSSALAGGSNFRLSW